MQATLTNLLSTYWVLKSGMQGAPSDPLRSDWLMGKEEEMGFAIILKIILIPGPHLCPFWTNYSTERLRLLCRRDFQGVGEMMEFPSANWVKWEAHSSHPPAL